MKIRQHSAVTVVFCALLALDVAHLEGEAKFQDTVLQYLESKEAVRMQNSDPALNQEDLEAEMDEFKEIATDQGDPALYQEDLEAEMDEFQETATDQGAKKLPGFRHIYQLDMTVPKRCCPDALQLHTSNSLRLCGKKTGTSCNSIIIPTYGKSYQEVRGVVRAYQFGSPDAFNTNKQGKIDSNYVDGVSITHGKSPRKHIWTYAIGYRQYKSGTVSQCTCPSTGGGRPQPAFVGDDYFCSSANPGNSGQKHGRWESVLYSTQLWSNIRGDCSDCGNDDLFFCKKLPKPTTDDLEIRVCTDEDLNNEDIHIEYMDFYIR